MKRMISKLILTVSAGVFLFGCYPGGPDYTEDLDVVYTTYSEKYNFASKSTYALPDKIVTDVEIDKGDTTYVYMRDIYAQPILAAIKSNMSSLGWKEVPISENPDVLVTPAAWTTTSYFYSYWYDWWYGGWYGGWYGWYYPPYYTVSSYTTGTLAITIADPNEDTPTGRTETKWLFAGNGLVSGAYDQARVLDAIDQGFQQSPYLNTK